MNPFPAPASYDVTSMKEEEDEKLGERPARTTIKLRSLLNDELPAGVAAPSIRLSKRFMPVLLD